MSTICWEDRREEGYNIRRIEGVGVSFQLMSWASGQTTGSPTRKAVLLALANRANHDTGNCHPSIETIAEETELSDATVRRALVDLTDAGLIVRKRRRRKDGTLGVYEYTFPHLASTAQSADTTAHSERTTDQGERQATDQGERAEPRSKPNLEVEPGTTSGAVAPVPEYDPIKGRRVDGRDLPWDAMVEATQAYGDANGARIKRALQSIRKDVADQAGPARVERFLRTEGWESYERTLADMIVNRAEMLKGRHPTLTWGPEGIARNWRLKPEETPEGVEQIVAQVLGAQS